MFAVARSIQYGVCDLSSWGFFLVRATVSSIEGRSTCQKVLEVPAIIASIFITRPVRDFETMSFVNLIICLVFLSTTKTDTILFCWSRWSFSKLNKRPLSLTCWSTPRRYPPFSFLLLFFFVGGGTPKDCCCLPVCVIFVFFFLSLLVFFLLLLFFFFFWWGGVWQTSFSEVKNRAFMAEPLLRPATSREKDWKTCVCKCVWVCFGNFVVFLLHVFFFCFFFFIKKRHVSLVRTLMNFV